MRRTPLLAHVLVLVFALQPLGAQTVDERIERIEAAVLPAFTIAGEETPVVSLRERMKALGVPGVSVAVLNDSHIEWARGYGMADTASERIVTPMTLFQAASISKPVAALAALTLVEDGVITLDGDVNDRLRRWKVPDNEFTAEEKVTLRRILNHTAGTTVWGFPGYASKRERPSTLDVLDGEGNTDAIRVFKIPGESWRYSGGGYTVMQLLLMDVTGKSFPQLMKEIVLDPAGMSGSTYEQPLPEERWKEAATAYGSDGSPVDEGWHSYPEMAAAGLWTTPSDLARYALQVQRSFGGEPGAILSQSMAATMLTAGMNDHGLGPGVQGEGTRFGHGGANAGFRASFTAFLREGRGAFVMTNSDSGGSLAQQIIFTIAAEYGWSGPVPAEKVPVELDASVLEGLAGDYEIVGTDTRIRLELSDGRLMLTTPGLEDELLSESESRFFLRSNGQTVEFQFEDGRAVGFTAGSYRARRLP